MLILGQNLSNFLLFENSTTRIAITLNLIKFLLTLCSMLNHLWQSICLIHAALVKVELTDPWWVTWFYENLRLCEFRSFSIILNNLGGPSINCIIKKMISFNSCKSKLFIVLLTSDVVVSFSVDNVRRTDTIYQWQMGTNQVDVMH